MSDEPIRFLLDFSTEEDARAVTVRLAAARGVPVQQVADRVAGAGTFLVTVSPEMIAVEPAEPGARSYPTFDMQRAAGSSAAVASQIAAWIAREQERRRDAEARVAAANLEAIREFGDMVSDARAKLSDSRSRTLGTSVGWLTLRLADNISPTELHDILGALTRLHRMATGEELTESRITIGQAAATATPRR